MLDIGTNLPRRPFPDQTRQVASTVARAPSAEKSSVKTGTIVVLSPTALKLSRELTAIQADFEKDPQDRLDATDKLRQLALKVVLGE
jgi:hypothetical protein